MEEENVQKAIQFCSPPVDKGPSSVSNDNEEENIDKEILNLAYSQNVSNTAKKRALTSLQDGKVPEYIKTCLLYTSDAADD